MYWKAGQRQSEWEFLLKARGLRGVWQLIGYGAEDYKVAVFRGTGEDVFAHTTERTLCQLLLEKYSGPLCCAPSPAQFLEALRDAVAGRSPCLRLALRY